MNALQPVASLKPGMRVKTSGGVRVVTSAGPYTSYGMPMWGWRWTPQVRTDGRQDCGYSGIQIEQAETHMVEVTQ
jgi:hypothetical protein